MKDRIHIYNSSSLPVCDYFVIGAVNYKAMPGQGDIGHEWTYLCRNTQSQSVLITEEYNISWWNPSGPGPSGISLCNLYRITEELLTEAEAAAYCKQVQTRCEKTRKLPFSIRM